MDVLGYREMCLPFSVHAIPAMIESYFRRTFVVLSRRVGYQGGVGGRIWRS